MSVNTAVELIKSKDMFPLLLENSINWVSGNGIVTGFLFSGDKNWNRKIKYTKSDDGNFMYHVDREPHCPYQPAVLFTDGTPLWYIEGNPLMEKDIETIKSILNDPKLAPLYINNPVYKYTARHVLAGTEK